MVLGHGHSVLQGLERVFLVVAATAGKDVDLLGRLEEGVGLALEELEGGAGGVVAGPVGVDGCKRIIKRKLQVIDEQDIPADLCLG